MDRPLHPNLARIAARYDDVMAAYRAGQLSPVEARRQVLTLVARDDNGLEWSIDPDTGLWRYRSRFGVMTTASPPTHGVMGFVPGDLGGGPVETPRVTFHQVDQDALHVPGMLAGSTSIRRTAPVLRRTLLAAALVLAATLTLVVTLIW